ncbi:MAG TPA: CHAP domain-containing protein [Candidatus Saccharimonadales bacterium]|nr:CHAP domain-containing protein [Candidatus Saccharimonadales bacterium]
MPKQNQTGFFRKFKLRARTLALLGIGVLFIGATPLVYAESLQQQINDLSNDNSQKQQSVNDLQLQASSYQDAIGKLQQQIGAIEGALSASTAQQASLQQQITADKQQITEKKASLADDVKTMYVDGQMSTIEELATSKNLSDYVDKEEYRTTVQNQLNDKIKEIADLQAKLETQKQQVDQLVSTQQQQQAKLDSDKQQQDSLLSYNQGQQDSYNQQIQANNKQLSALQAEQARINAASSRSVSGVAPSGGSGGACDNGHGNGGYPMAWCNATQDSLTTSGGFPNRECTSFAYWYYTSVEGKSLSVYGNAKDWIYTSNRPVTQTPHVGDIFVNTKGDFGHVGIVTGFDGGYVTTISMNDDYYGHFYNNREYPISSLYYIN